MAMEWDLKYLLIGALVVVVLILMFPDIKRYIQISTM